MQILIFKSQKNENISLHVRLTIIHVHASNDLYTVIRNANTVFCHNVLCRSARLEERKWKKKCLCHNSLIWRDTKTELLTNYDIQIQIVRKQTFFFIRINLGIAEIYTNSDLGRDHGNLLSFLNISWRTTEEQRII